MFRFLVWVTQLFVIPFVEIGNKECRSNFGKTLITVVFKTIKCDMTAGIQKTYLTGRWIFEGIECSYQSMNIKAKDMYL